VGKPKGKRPLADMCTREDNVKMDSREIGWGVVDWINLTLDKDKWRALVNMIMSLQIP
jgi:hypothetical protein